MKKNKIINGLLFGVLAGMSQIGSAAITSETILNFNKGNPDSPTIESTPGNLGLILTGYSGSANVLPEANGRCAGSGPTDCYYEDGLVVGIVKEATDNGAHLHGLGSSTNRRVGYESDSTGIYIRAQDSSAFSLTSLRFLASASTKNPDANGTYVNDDEETVIGVAGPNDYWEILGYGSALNPTLETDNDNGAWIAKKTITNGFSGNVFFDDNGLWQNISAIWIHYHGYQHTPLDGKQFDMSLDNVVVNSPVPVPAAVWMFGTGLLGLASVTRRKAA
jgi:hypothetical protein